MTNFTVDSILGHRIIHVTLSGILTLEEVEQLGRAQAELVRRNAYGAGTFDALIDVSTAPIQPLDVTAALNALSEQDDFRPARLAFVHAGAAVKMQVRRVNAHKVAAHFTDHAGAMAWLATDEPPFPPPARRGS